MQISFIPLQTTHFPLLLRWLEMPHVKAWWDKDIRWTPDLIAKKYGSYVAGYKIEEGTRKPIHTFIICVDNTPIGYVQWYNAHDFTRSAPLTDLPKKLAAFDIFIGEPNYLGKGIGSHALKKFLDTIIDRNRYTHVFADPDAKNFAAIAAYKKVGFNEIKNKSTNEIWMLYAYAQK